MSDNAELHRKILEFLSGEFARKEGRQCVGVDLLFAPGNGFRDEEIRKWVRADDPELFDSFINIEKLVSMIVEIAEGEADAKPAGKHRFVVRTHQHMGGRATQSFALAPSYHGSDESAMMVSSGGGGGGRQDMIVQILANHANQHMRINAQMHDSTIRVLAVQNASVMQQNTELHAENIKLRREIDEHRLNKDERDFQYAMAAEKNARTNAGFQKLLQIGTVVAAKIGAGSGGGAEAALGGESHLVILIRDFYTSLRQEQLGVLMNTLDMGQKIMFTEIVNQVKPPDPPEGAGPQPQPPRGINGVGRP